MALFRYTGLVVTQFETTGIFSANAIWLTPDKDLAENYTHRHDGDLRRIYTVLVRLDDSRIADYSEISDTTDGGEQNNEIAERILASDDFDAVWLPDTASGRSGKYELAISPLANAVKILSSELCDGIEHETNWKNLEEFSREMRSIG